MGKNIYIPHGSDESRERAKMLAEMLSFISHMVQMKDRIDICAEIYKLTFISHMVQMKAIKIQRRTEILNEFISHMVQMKEFIKYLFFKSSHIYIPHGSDESLSKDRIFQVKC